MVLATVTVRRPPQEGATVRAHQPQPSAVAPTAAPDREPAGAIAAAQGTQPPQSRQRATQRRIQAEPEVLVPAEEPQALLRLVALVNSSGSVPPVLGAVDLPPARLAQPDPIDIKPIEIVPLDPALNSGT
jgi:hypothetical protein